MLFNPTPTLNRRMLISTLGISENDVVLGRGARNARRPGNRKWLSLVDSHVVQYSMSNTEERKDIVSRAVDEFFLRLNGGRFLKFDKTRNGYYEISRDTALFKARQTFINRSEKKTRQQQTIVLDVLTEEFWDNITFISN